MENIWTWVGAGLFTVGTQALIAGAWWTIGGLGALSRINRSLSKFEDDIHHLDTRLSREQKVRASVAARDVRKGGDIAQDATERLAAAAAMDPEDGRPSTAHLVR